MKVRIMFLLSLLCSITSFASCNGANWKAVKYSILPDSCVHSNLGKTMSEILFNPSKVTCYTIKGKSTVEKEDSTFDSFFGSNGYNIMR